ncbi:hypothetical protein SRHO_G00136990 [Serrasalmus rhombeus]
MKRNACVDRGLSPPALLSAFDHGEALCFGAQADDNTSPTPAWNPSCPGQVTAGEKIAVSDARLDETCLQWAPIFVLYGLVMLS